MTVGEAGTAKVRDATRRLTLSIVLATCIGGGAYQLIDRRGDCTVVGDMMRTYIAYVDQAAPRRAGIVDPALAADAEAMTASRLQRLTGDIELAPLRAYAVEFADALAESARVDRAAAGMPIELDPIRAILPELDSGQLELDNRLFGSAHVLLTACPSAPRPYGLS